MFDIVWGGVKGGNSGTQVIPAPLVIWKLLHTITILWLGCYEQYVRVAF